VDENLLNNVCEIYSLGSTHDQMVRRIIGIDSWT